MVESRQAGRANAYKELKHLGDGGYGDVWLVMRIKDQV